MGDVQDNADDCEKPASCAICLEDTEDSWSCGKQAHVFCRNCLRIYLNSKIEEHETQFSCPFYLCTSLVNDLAVAETLSVSQLSKYMRLKRKSEDPNLKDCPQCGELVSKPKSSLEMKCGNCSTEFCFLHDLAHPGYKCVVDETLWQSMRSKAWKWIHTRECPKCHRSIQKNGGCSHVTCKCGHEICWRCGKDYVRNGRRGHSFSWFPRPSEFKYCCNDTKMWICRTGASIVVVPIAGIFLGIIAAAAVVSLPIGAMYVTEMVGRRIKHRLKPKTTLPIYISASTSVKDSDRTSEKQTQSDNISEVRVLEFAAIRLLEQRKENVIQQNSPMTQDDNPQSTGSLNTTTDLGLVDSATAI